jgi:hypothetical protein
MARFLDLVNLCSQPESLRDADWERTFLAAIVDSSLEIKNKDAQQGPDGWPYLYVTTSRTATEPALRLIDWLSTRGIGMVINAHKEMPDYIFTFGMIWGFKAFGQFRFESETLLRDGPVTFEKGQKVIAGPPTEDYLPIYVREILADFFAKQGVKHPKIIVLSKDKKHYDLCFSVESLGNPPQPEFSGIAEAIAWFLPEHYSIVVTSEKGLPPFFPLVSEELKSQS